MVAASGAWAQEAGTPAVQDTSVSVEARAAQLAAKAEEDPTGQTAFEIARLYAKQNDPESAKEAKSWIDRAVDRDRENAEYRAFRAGLEWRLGGREDVRKEAEKVLELDPQNADAYYWVGRYWAWMMRRWSDAERVEATYGEDPYELRIRRSSLSYFGDEGRDKAIANLSRALEIDPDHKDARILLGLVYYESGRAKELVELFRGYLDRHPGDANARFVVGLGYRSLGDLQRAYASFVAGLEKMDERQQRFMTSVLLVASTGEASADSTLPDVEAVRRFWTGRDPLFLTPLNERMMEHCSRVAYANLRFADPVRGLEGWETDMGQVYIRYGEPKRRRTTPAEIVTGVEQPLWYQDYLAERARQFGTVPFEEAKRTEMWDYGEFRIYFVNPRRDYWRYEIAFRYRIPLGLETLTELVPDAFEDPYSWIRYDASHQVGQFRGDDGKTRLEMTYALPLERLATEPVRKGIKRVDVNQGLFLFDASWDTLKSDVQKVEMMPWVQYDAAREGFLFASERLNLEPGRYFLAAEAQDVKTGSVGAFRQPLEVRDFSGDSLQVSSLLLARRVVERQNAPFGRDRFLILPNPLGRCERDGQAAFYFEVYNLSRNEFGATHYEVTYQVQVEPDDESEEPEWSTAVSYTREGSTDWEPNYLSLDLADIMPGPRSFRVVVRDLLAGTEASAGTEFRIMW